MSGDINSVTDNQQGIPQQSDRCKGQISQLGTGRLEQGITGQGNDHTVSVSRYLRSTKHRIRGQFCDQNIVEVVQIYCLGDKNRIDTQGAALLSFIALDIWSKSR